MSQILKTKNMWGCDQYLLVDAGLGFLIGSMGIVMSLPQLHDFFQSVDASGQVTQSIAQYLAQIGTQVTLDTVAFIGWLNELDVAKYGKTKSMRYALGASKKLNSFFEI